MEVAAVAGQMRERLRHERRDQPALLGQRLDHVAEEDRPVAGRQGVCKREVLLELAVGVLVVGRVVVPPEAGDGGRDLRNEVEVASQRAHVVTRLLERVERIGELEAAVGGAPQQEVLELGADLELISLIGRPRQRPAQDRPRAVRPRLAFDGDVARQACHGRTPRQDRQRRRVGHRDHVGAVGPLSDVARGEPGEPGALGQQVVEMMGGDELGARLAVHVDELGEQELDAVVFDDLADVVGIAWCVFHEVQVYPAPRVVHNGLMHPA